MDVRGRFEFDDIAGLNREASAVRTADTRIEGRVRAGENVKRQVLSPHDYLNFGVEVDAEMSDGDLVPDLGLVD